MTENKLYTNIGDGKSTITITIELSATGLSHLNNKWHAPITSHILKWSYKIENNSENVSFGSPLFAVPLVPDNKLRELTPEEEKSCNTQITQIEEIEKMMDIVLNGERVLNCKLKHHYKENINKPKSRTSYWKIIMPTIDIEPVKVWRENKRNNRIEAECKECSYNIQELKHLLEEHKKHLKFIIEGNKISGKLDKFITKKVETVYENEYIIKDLIKNFQDAKIVNTDGPTDNVNSYIFYKNKQGRMGIFYEKKEYINDASKCTIL
jgi:hypothetical protein